MKNLPLRWQEKWKRSCAINQFQDTLLRFYCFDARNRATDLTTRWNHDSHASKLHSLERGTNRHSFSRGTAPRRHASRRSANLISPSSFIFARLMAANLLSLPRYRRVLRLCQQKPRKDERKGSFFLSRRGYTEERFLVEEGSSFLWRDVQEENPRHRGTWSTRHSSWDSCIV